MLTVCFVAHYLYSVAGFYRISQNHNNVIQEGNNDQNKNKRDLTSANMNYISFALNQRYVYLNIRLETHLKTQPFAKQTPYTLCCYK